MLSIEWGKSGPFYCGLNIMLERELRSMAIATGCAANAAPWAKKIYALLVPHMAVRPNIGYISDAVKKNRGTVSAWFRGPSTHPPAIDVCMRIAALVSEMTGEVVTLEDIFGEDLNAAVIADADRAALEVADKAARRRIAERSEQSPLGGSGEAPAKRKSGRSPKP